ncbi:MAG: hypothetical protein JWO82_264, partial [Akkermansiaceae bacterium]|nr:hypothetical protein [Akkermansiaceae bacterium]
MLVFGLSGGIASGKSTACGILKRLCPGLVLFDSDVSVHGLYRRPEVVRGIAGIFGDSAVGADGVPDRSVLRQKTFENPALRRELEGLLHPLVRQECLDTLKSACESGAPLFVADVPLLFETGFDFGQQGRLLIAASLETRSRRLRERNGFEDAVVKSILAAQMPQEEKIRQADIVFWNEGPPPILEAQLHRFLHSHAIMSEDTIPDDVPAAVQPIAEPQTININEFRTKPLSELLAMAEAVPARIQTGLSKSQLCFDLLSFYANEGANLIGEGVVEQAKENYAMLRDPSRSFRTSPDDLYVNGHLLRDHGLKAGHLVKVRIRAPRDRDKFLSAVEVLEIEGIAAADFKAPKDFDKLTPMFPDRRIVLEGEGPEFAGVRALDLVAPLGKGQRGLIVAPPRGGKTILLKQIAKSIRRNHPEVELIVVLLDERPEEVTDFEETVGTTVYASTFDEVARRHAQVADLVIERARRLVEMGKDVVLLLDSLTRLARGHNSALKGGPIGSGGISPVALQKSRKFFGNARNVEEGGSLTILATALIETESRMDDVIFEEFKGTGNME